MKRIALAIINCMCLLKSAEAFETKLDYLGVSMFTPSIINVVAAVQLPLTTVKLSAGSGDEGSYELGFTFKRWPSSEVLRSVQFVAGKAAVSSPCPGCNIDVWDYAGVGATLQGDSFFVEPSFTFSDDEDHKQEVLLKLGWLYNF